jgi:hypothetical protein
MPQPLQADGEATRIQLACLEPNFGYDSAAVL